MFLRKYYLYLSRKSAVRYGFIPDICSLTRKYNLTDLVNTFISDLHCLPNKRQWKNIVSNAVAIRESALWNQRQAAEADFLFFRILHPIIQPCVVYNVFKNSSSRHYMTTIANLWRRAPLIENNACPFCKIIICEELIHILSDCKLTETLRERFKTDIETIHGSIFLNEISGLDNFSWSLKLLGATIPPLLDDEGQQKYLVTAFKYVTLCLSRL